jgi:WD40 repeat protein
MGSDLDERLRALAQRLGTAPPELSEGCEPPLGERAPRAFAEALLGPEIPSPAIRESPEQTLGHEFVPAYGALIPTVREGLGAEGGAIDLPRISLLPAEPRLSQRPRGRLPLGREQPGRYAPVSEDGSETELGRGGLGRVTVAMDLQLGREVAIKELFRENAGHGGEGPGSAEAQLLREACVTGQLEHPNIVPVYDVGRRADGLPYYTMRVVRGRTLGSAIAETRSVRDRLALISHFARLCHAIAYAHTRGVIHRDIKPSNVMLGEFGETVVLDWGISRVLGAADDRAQDIARRIRFFAGARPTETVEGSVFGTPAYMSPEQALGRVDDVDELSDVWSLGAVLYVILTGRVPFEGHDAPSMLEAVLHQPLLRVRDLAPEIPAELAAIAERALERNRELRYQNARDMARDVEAFQAGDRVLAYEYTSWELLCRFVEKNRTSVVVGMVGLVALLMLGITSGLGVLRTRDRALYAEAAAKANQRDAQVNLAAALTEKALAALSDGATTGAELLAAQALSLDERADARGIVVSVSNLRRPRPSTDLPGVGACASYAYAFGAGLLACARDTRVILWSLPEERVVATLAGAGSPIRALGLSADESTLVAGTDDGFALIWSLETRAAPKPMRVHAGRVTSVALDRGGALLATASMDTTVRLWWLPKGESLVTLPVGEPVSAVALGVESSVLAVGTSFGRVALWDWTEGRERLQLPGHTGTVEALAFAPLEQYLASASLDRSVRIFDLATGTPLGDPLVGPDAVLSLAWSPNGKYLAAGSQQGALRLLDMAARSKPVELAGHQQGVRMAAFSTDSKALATSSGDLGLRLWNLSESGAPARLVQGANVLSLGFIPQSRQLWTTGLRKTGVCLWDIDRGRCTTRLPISAERARASAVSTDGLRLVLGDSDGRIQLWDLRSKLPVEVHDSHRGEVRAVAFAPHGDYVLSGGDDGIVRLWAVDSARESSLGAQGVGVLSIAHSPREPLAAVARKSGVIEIWNVETRERTRDLQGHVDWVMALAFSPDGRFLASAGADSTLRLWDVRLGELVQNHRGHQGRVTSVAFSSDGAWLASGGEDHSVRIWDIARGQLVSILIEHDAIVRSVAFHPADARTLASADDDGITRLWALNTLGRSGTEILANAQDEFRVALRGTVITAAP